MRDWSKRTAVVLASGPSLAAEDCLAVAKSTAATIAVNATFRLAPWTDVIYMGDLMAVRTYDVEIRQTCGAGWYEKWTCDSVAKQQYGWNLMPGLMRCGNSGAQAIHLAAKFGAKRILLLGFDMKLGENGRRHWHEEHPKPCVQRSLFDEWMLKMAVLAKELESAGVSVVNCTRSTALTCFPRGVLEDELCR